MLWAWRQHSRASLLKRIFPSLLLSFFTLSSSLVAGIFSSRVATSSNGEVLISSLNCGGLFQPSSISPVGGPVYSYFNTWMESSYNYAQSCYGSNTFRKDCTLYPRQSLPFSITRDIACPFPGQDSICRNMSGNIQIDTGFINSHFDLGINAPPENRFLLRFVAECAPLLTDRYTRVQKSAAIGTLINILYGPTRRDFNSGATYQYPNATTPNNIDYGIFDYVLDVESTAFGWTPIPELHVTDGDVIVLFLSSNNIWFLNKTADPWYSAQELVEYLLVGNNQIPLYAHDDAVRALGCRERFQFCNPNLPGNSSCTPLTSSRQAFQLGFQLWQDLTQQAYFNWSTSFFNIGIDTTVSIIGTAALQSRNTLSDGIQWFIPDNQWELEVENLFKVSLASLQRSVVDQAMGPADPALLPMLKRPNTPEEQKVCANQKIRSYSYASINVLGLVIIFAIGGLIIVMSFALPIIVRWIQKRQNSYSTRAPHG